MFVYMLYNLYVGGYSFHFMGDGHELYMFLHLFIYVVYIWLHIKKWIKYRTLRIKIINLDWASFCGKMRAINIRKEFKDKTAELTCRCNLNIFIIY
jgi:uncharacterized membrane protein YkgB